MSTERLYDMLDGIIEGEDTSARAHFHAYLTNKMKNELGEEADAEFIDEETTKYIDTVTRNARIAIVEQLTNQWIVERDILVEAVDSQVGEYLETEMAELRKDIKQLRDLEAS